MLVSSTINPSCRSSVQLLIVHYNDERVLVPVELHAKFSDLQEFIIKEWALETHTFMIETEELDICAGKRVRIHEEAWLGIKDIVGNVYVRVSRAERSQQHQYASSVKNEVKYEEVSTSRAASESSDEAEVEQQTKTEIKKSDFDEETPTVRRRDQAVKQDKKEENRPESPKKQKPLGDTLNLFSDDADADEGKENPTGQPRKSWKSLLGSLHRSSPNANTNTNSDNAHTNTNKPAVSAPSTRAPTKAIINPAGIVSTSGDHAMPAPASVPVDSERVLIIVEPPQDSIYEPRGFRIRREHSVRTVLKGACKAFKIDYTKTRLRMVTEVHENDVSSQDSQNGELVTVKCDDMATMNSLNVEDNQRFIIEMVDGDGEEEEGDGESEA